MVSSLLKRKSLDEYTDFDSFQNVDRINVKDVIKKIKRLTNDGRNGQKAFELRENNIIRLIPRNTGLPINPLIWYNKNGSYEEIINNQYNFNEITNLSQILNKITDVMIESYEKKEPLSSFNNFGIKLTDEIQPNYTGNGKLILLIGNFLNDNAKKNPEEATIYFINQFFDNFISYNFGNIIRNENELEKKLLDFNQRLIDDGTKFKESLYSTNVSVVPGLNVMYHFNRI